MGAIFKLFSVFIFVFLVFAPSSYADNVSKKVLNLDKAKSGTSAGKPVKNVEIWTQEDR